MGKPGEGRIEVASLNRFIEGRFVATQSPLEPPGTDGTGRGSPSLQLRGPARPSPAQSIRPAHRPPGLAGTQLPRTPMPGRSPNCRARRQAVGWTESPPRWSTQKLSLHIRPALVPLGPL